MQYHVFERLGQHHAQLKRAAQLDGGIGLSQWYNCNDHIALDKPAHHTLSLYVADGYESYRKTSAGWRNGGAPDRFCLMPGQHESTWDIRGPLEFVHLYFTDQHLAGLAERVWDKDASGLLLDEKTFADDPLIASLYRQWLLALDWQERADRLALDSTVTLLLVHLLRSYSQRQRALPRPRGGLAPYRLRQVLDYIEAHLDRPLPLAELAAQVQLSEYHFARMFKQSQGLSPHQYVLQRRLARAETLLHETTVPLAEIALACGFSSSSHLASRFRQAKGVAPSQLRESTPALLPEPPADM
ncbi:helix-turn-helix domain-containing protein [Halomonas sp. MCCC 1A11057]|uniref:AraC family transcriptional regulator n=1 Tax=Halomonas sp. MCCC 1A11057 TaxID=2733482 RepID=UPI001F2CF53B|nr:helix-turn-helix domain-containing protein [Halomonas sp. MCCC 1A11057]MCE8033321.1 helix-turn-helix domain-containing protein [Halomonas sp. MCCC 1A11057]